MKNAFACRTCEEPLVRNLPAQKRCLNCKVPASSQANDSSQDSSTDPILEEMGSDVNSASEEVSLSGKLIEDLKKRIYDLEAENARLIIILAEKFMTLSSLPQSKTIYTISDSSSPSNFATRPSYKNVAKNSTKHGKKLSTHTIILKSFSIDRLRQLATLLELSPRPSWNQICH